jgi:hypothetical protein
MDAECMLYAVYITNKVYIWNMSAIYLFRAGIFHFHLGTWTIRISWDIPTYLISQLISLILTYPLHMDKFPRQVTRIGSEDILEGYPLGYPFRIP